MITDIVTLCHSATITNNQINILGAFDTIYTKSVPTGHPPFTAVVRACFSPEEVGQHQLILRIVDPDGRTLGEMTISLSLSKESFDPKFTLSITFPINGMELRCFGEYAIDLLLDNEEPIRTAFYVKEAK
ncbi:MAG: hypothetical protein WCO60_17870 [Verrucomicrobiota bacterium]